MYCSKCGREVRNGAKFCDQCGTSVLKKKKPIGKIIGILAAIAVVAALSVAVVLTGVIGVIGGVFLVRANSLENRLTRDMWWYEPRFYNEPYDYSDSDWFKEQHPGAPEKGYWVTGTCASIRFCQYGTIRNESYSAPPSYSGGGAYMFSYEATADHYSPSMEWTGWSSNSTTWSLMDNKTLVIYDETYFWDENEAENTWYLSGDTLRIGKDYLTKVRPNINCVSDMPPYWCENCGQEGPFASTCPNCGDTKKRSD